MGDYKKKLIRWMAAMLLLKTINCHALHFLIFKSCIAKKPIVFYLETMKIILLLFCIPLAIFVALLVPSSKSRCGTISLNPYSLSKSNLLLPFALLFFLNTWLTHFVSLRLNVRIKHS